jgi:nucleoside-diphosphate-sugar epimerase
MQRVLVTGSAGRIGRKVRAGLAAPDRPLRLLDIADQHPPRPGEPVELVRADLADRRRYGAPAPAPTRSSTSAASPPRPAGTT